MLGNRKGRESLDRELCRPDPTDYRLSPNSASTKSSTVSQLYSLGQCLVLNLMLIGQRRPSRSWARFLFDDLVGAREQHRRHFEAEHRCSLQIDNQLESCRLKDRQIARVGAGKNLAGVDAVLTIAVVDVGAIARQPARVNERAELVYGRNSVLGGQADQVRTACKIELVGTDHERFRPSSTQ